MSADNAIYENQLVIRNYQNRAHTTDLRRVLETLETIVSIDDGTAVLEDRLRLVLVEVARRLQLARRIRLLLGLLNATWVSDDRPMKEMR